MYQDFYESDQDAIVINQFEKTESLESPVIENGNINNTKDEVVPECIEEVKF